jgi:preprotein translocase subunit SecB
MAKKKAATAPSRNVDLRMSSPPELAKLHFSRDDAAPTSQTNQAPPLLFSLELSRFSTNRLGVELTVEIKDFAPLQILAAYRCVFAIESDSELGDVEQELRLVAAQIGPSALYPFLREAIASTVAKAGLPAVVPPIVNFRGVFNPDEVVLPPVPDESRQGAAS